MIEKAVMTTYVICSHSKVTKRTRDKKMRTSTNLLHPIAMGQKKGGHDELHRDCDALIDFVCLLVIRLML